VVGQPARAQGDTQHETEVTRGNGSAGVMHWRASCISR
jgi:hypothetical protein